MSHELRRPDNSITEARAFVFFWARVVGLTVRFVLVMRFGDVYRGGVGDGEFICG